MKDGREAIDFLFKQRLNGFGCHVMAGKAGTAGGEHNVDIGRVDPVLDLRTNGADIIFDDGTIGQFMAAGLQQFNQRIAGFVIAQLARVGDRHYSNINGNEG